MIELLMVTRKYLSIEARRRLFGVRVVAMWNSLPEAVVTLPTLPTFKSALHKHLGNILYEYYN